MNKVYKIVWNESLGTWCAISEVSKTRGKRSSAKTTVAGVLLGISALTMSSMAGAADHYVSINDGGTQGGNYNNDGATGLNAIAVGVGAKAAGENAIAIGNVSADAINSIAIGNNNSLSNSASSSTAIGHNNNVTGNDALALGANNTVKDFSGVAVGSYNNAEGYRSIAVGAENKTKGQWSSAFGVWNIAEGERATVLGANNTIQGTRALGVGVANEISSASEYSSAVGAFNKITDNTKSLTAGFRNTVIGGEKNSVLGNENTLNNAKNTTVLGNKNTVAQENTQVLGNNVTTTQANSVVLGNESTDRVATTVNQVAINGEDYAVTGAGSAANGVVSVGNVGGERQIINVAAGEVSASSTDAVNGSQLYATHKAIADSQTHYVSINDSGTQGGNYNNDGATGKNALAVGVGAKAVGENDIAIGLKAGTNNDGGWNTSVGSNSGQNINGQKNTALGVGAGHDVRGNNNTVLGVDAGITVTGDSNLAVGDFAGAKVRGSGNTALGKMSGFIVTGTANTATGQESGRNVEGHNNSAFGVKSGNNVQGDSNLALGDSAGENVTGNRNVALGRAAGQGLNNVDDATSLGSGAKAAVRNSVALGANSEAIRDVNSEVAYVPLGTTIVAAKAAGGEVSVGAVGKERRISNVAAASQDTDAVNLSQLKAVQAATTTHYFSINDGGTQGGNYNNDGAAASGSVAIGVDSSSFGTSGVAIGHNADVSGLQGIAIGNNAQAGYQSIALGFDTVATAFNSMALGNRAIAYTDGTTLGQGTYANKLATAMGNGALAVGQESSAYGYSALAGTDSFNQPSAGTDPDTIGKAYATAMGSRAKASAQGSTAVGAGSVAEVDNGIALGANSVANTGAGVAGYVPISANQPQKDAINATQSTLGAVSVGSVGNTRQITNVAAGTIDSDAVNVAQLKAVQAATTTHYFSVNDEGIQGNNYNNDGATGKNALAAGRALAGGESSVAIGEGASAKADFSTAVGFLNTVTGKNSIAIGASNNVAQENTQVLGNNVTTTQANSVVLGNASTDRAATAVDKVSINGEYYNFAGVGSTANGVVSVGKVGGERQIINVAAGEISASSTDAINGSQLHATNQAVEKLYAGAGDTTHYVSVNDKGIKQGNYNNDGASGALAVAVGVSASAKGDGATALGLNSSAKSKDAVAIGTDTRAELEGSVALGKGSVANTAAGIAGFDPLTGFGSTNTGSTWRSSAAAFSVGDVSRGITRQITGVAAGTADTDAVNVAQLKAAISKTNEAKGSTETVSAGKNTEVTKNTQADGSTDYQVATKDDVSFDSVTVGNIKADSQSNTISGLADGKVSADSDQAINGSQLHDTAESVANALGGNAKVNPDGTIKTSNIGNTGKDNVHDAIASIHGQVTGAKTSVSAGKNTVVNSSTNADGSNNYQVALAEDIQLNSVTANQVTAKQVTANKVNVGKVTIDGTTNKVSGLANGEITSSSTDAINGSQLHQTNSSVAQHLGGGSTLNKDGSIGAPTYNVAGGTFHNVGDALGAIDTRVSNLEQAFYDTNKNMDDLRNDTYGGIAGAMAVGNLPQPTEAGMSMVSAGVSGYRGETAVAIGVSAITDSNKIVWKMGASADSRSNIGGAVSMGYQWK
ncbi:YadA-like family protein [Acinetobacter guillouiae]|uniref:YadA-like family protein n=1 Tax=Acinetobacter guillouiae TaxID=106649 RepID=UPI002E250184